MDDAQQVIAQRRALYEQFPVSPVGFSSDGRDVRFTGPLELGLEVGGFAVIDRDDGTRVVLQVRSVGLEERDGPSITFDHLVAETQLHVSQATITPRLRAVAGEAVVLGRFEGDEFVSTGAVGPFGEQLVRPASGDEVAAALLALERGAPVIEVGVLRQLPDVGARLRAAGFSRHTFMCGQSGSGKTYTTGVLFERLLAATSLPLVILDPNSDHVHLGSVADADDASPAAERYRRVAGEVSVARARGNEADITLCADFSDLTSDVQARLLRLHPIADLDDYNALLRVTERLGATYTIHEVAAAAAAGGDATARIARRIENLRLDTWEVWRRPGEPALYDLGPRRRRCLVIDIGSLATPEERTSVALAVLGNRWRTRRERQPTLIAIDEAHNVLPAVTDDPLLHAAADIGVLIAGEGRKFGLHLFVASQRPGKVHPNVISQCDNLVLMRMNGVADVDELVTSFSHVPSAMIRQAVGFGLGQALFAGPVAPVPLLTQVGSRLTLEGGGDVPTTWATRPD